MPLQRRAYADAVTDKIKLDLALPHQVCAIDRALPAIGFCCLCFVLSRYESSLTCDQYSQFTSPPTCMCFPPRYPLRARLSLHQRQLIMLWFRVQVNLPAESGDMGVLANHVASIEQLKPGIVQVIEESGGTKEFFRMCHWSKERYKI